MKRRGMLIVALGAVLIAASAGVPELPKSQPAPVPDYVQYWAASRVNLAGGNPYDWRELLAAERKAEPSLSTPVLMWNPPWTLSLTVLASLLPYAPSRVLWMLISSLMLAGACGYLWHYWRGASKGLIGGVALAAIFPPSIFVLLMGQISPVMLLGIVAFLYFERKQQLAWAGAAAAVTLVKPQVVFLFWVGLLIWSLHGRRWRLIAGAAAAMAAMCAVPLATNGQVFWQYAQALRYHPPDYFVTPTLGTLLRLLVGWEHTWLAFVPSLVGVGWLVGHWIRNRSGWSWSSQISLVLLVSVITSPYAWLFDQVVLLPPVLQLAALHSRSPSRLTKRASFVYVLAVIVAFAVLPWDVFVYQAAPGSSGLLRKVLTTPNMFWHVTVAPMFLVGSLIHIRGEGVSSPVR